MFFIITFKPFQPLPLPGWLVIRTPWQHRFYYNSNVCVFYFLIASLFWEQFYREIEHIVQSSHILPYPPRTPHTHCVSLFTGNICPCSLHRKLQMAFSYFTRDSHPKTIHLHFKYPESTLPKLHFLSLKRYLYFFKCISTPAFFF